MKRRGFRAGQSTLEYAVLIAVVAAAAIGMQIYVKRGIQGRLRQSADQVGEQFTPVDYTANFSTETRSSRHETLDVAGASSSEISGDEHTTRTGEDAVPALDTEHLFTNQQ